MFFITTRHLQEGLTPKDPNALPRRVNFDFSNNEPGASVYACFRNEDSVYFEQGLEKFFNDINRRPHEHLLFYIHGFNSQPEPGVFPMTSKLQTMFDAKAYEKVSVIPIIWACDTQGGMIENYYDDQICADKSGIAIARFWCFFLDWMKRKEAAGTPFTKKVHVLAHSMGNRVYRNSLLDMNRYFYPDIPVLFKNSFLTAADVTNESLEPGNEGVHVVEASSWVSVYYACDDVALMSSRWANFGRTTSSRLGHTGVESVADVRYTVLNFDCSDFNQQYEPTMGHTYFANSSDGATVPGKVFNHIWQTITAGRPQITPANAQRTVLV